MMKYIVSPGLMVNSVRSSCGMVIWPFDVTFDEPFRIATTSRPQLRIALESLISLLQLFLLVRTVSNSVKMNDVSNDECVENKAKNSQKRFSTRSLQRWKG